MGKHSVETFYNALDGKVLTFSN